MINLSELSDESLHGAGWEEVLKEFPEIDKAKCNPVLFRHVGRFVRQLKQTIHFAAELNSDRQTVEAAYQGVVTNKILFKNKAINRFEDINHQTWKITLQALEHDIRCMYEAFCAGNFEELENRYREINKWLSVKDGMPEQRAQLYKLQEY